MDTKIIGFYGLKGGTGKSTNNSLLSSWLQKKEKKKVLLLDVDEDQQSISKWRNRDISNNLVDEYTYEVQQMLSSEASEIIEQIKNRGFYDYIIVDIPGTLNQEGVFEILAYVDVAFIPTSATTSEFEDAIKFIKLTESLNEVRLKNGLLKTKKYITFTQVDGRLKEEKEILNNLDKLEEAYGVKFMNNHLKYYPKLKLKYSTIDLMETENWSYNVEKLLKECVTKINE